MKRLARITLAAALASVSVATSADQQGDLLLLLACAPSSVRQQDRAAAEALFRSIETKDGDGGSRVAGPIRSGSACVERVEIAAAFGVLMVAGRLCNEDHRSLVDLLRRAGMPLQSKAGSDPRVIEAYEAFGKYAISFVEGEVSLKAGQSPRGIGDGNVTSYVCTFRGSGPQ
ncbi:MAG: hypothetical protein AB1430_23380 [Pseudomonadota bacterium]